MNYILHILVMLEIYILLALSANQKVGLSGLLSLAQAVFYGVGAYASAIVITKFGFSYWLALPVAISACVITALIFSFIAGKVRELYFSLATLALQIIFFSVCYNWITAPNKAKLKGVFIFIPKISGFEIPEMPYEPFVTGIQL